MQLILGDEELAEELDFWLSLLSLWSELMIKSLAALELKGPTVLSSSLTLATAGSLFPFITGWFELLLMAFSRISFRASAAFRRAVDDTSLFA